MTMGRLTKDSDGGIPCICAKNDSGRSRSSGTSTASRRRSDTHRKQIRPWSASTGSIYNCFATEHKLAFCNAVGFSRKRTECSNEFGNKFYIEAFLPSFIFIVFGSGDRWKSSSISTPSCTIYCVTQTKVGVFGSSEKLFSLMEPWAFETTLDQRPTGWAGWHPWHWAALSCSWLDRRESRVWPARCARCCCSGHSPELDSTPAGRTLPPIAELWVWKQPPWSLRPWAFLPKEPVGGRGAGFFICCLVFRAGFFFLLFLARLTFRRNKNSI